MSTLFAPEGYGTCVACGEFVVRGRAPFQNPESFYANHPCGAFCSAAEGRDHIIEREEPDMPPEGLDCHSITRDAVEGSPSVRELVPVVTKVTPIVDQVLALPLGSLVVAVGGSGGYGARKPGAANDALLRTGEDGWRQTYGDDCYHSRNWVRGWVERHERHGATFLVVGPEGEL